MSLNKFEAKIFGISKDEFSTAIKFPVFNGESGKREQFTDWILEFKAVAGLGGKVVDMSSTCCKVGHML